jgi:hypothetical protein
MDEALFAKIVDEISPYSELVYLYGTGESLLHDKLYNYTRYAHDHGLATCLSTNGMLMDRASAESLLDCGLDFLIVALDGGTKQTYESIRLKGNFDRVIGNIKKLLRLKARMGSKTHVCLQMIYMEKNAHEVELFKGLFSQEEKRQISQMRFKPLFETYALKNNKMKHTRPCYWLWNMLFVAWNGQAGLCCMDYDASYDLGDLRTESVAEVWAGEQVLELRRRHKSLAYDDMKLCSTCDIPEQGYFNNQTIACSALINAARVRKIMPLYEKLLLRGGGR